MNKRKWKIVYYFMFCIIPLSFSLYNFGPDIIFYFDEVEGKARIHRVMKHNVIVDYYHKPLNADVRINFKVNTTNKIKKLSAVEEWDILYSSNFPERAILVGINEKPAFGSLIFIMIFVFPLFFTKSYSNDWWESNK